MIRPPPWLLPGSFGLVPRFSIATMQRLRLPSFISVARSPSPADTLGVRAFSFSSACTTNAKDKDFGKPVSPVPVLAQGNGRPSHLPGKPQCCSATLSDPGRTFVPDRTPSRLLLGTPVLSPLLETRRLHQSMNFRGSITRLYNSLSTLRAGISTDDARLASGGWSGLPGGSVPAGFDLRISIADSMFSFVFMF